MRPCRFKIVRRNDCSTLQRHSPANTLRWLVCSIDDEHCGVRTFMNIPQASVLQPCLVFQPDPGPTQVGLRRVEERSLSRSFGFSRSISTRCSGTSSSESAPARYAWALWTYCRVFCRSSSQSFAGSPACSRMRAKGTNSLTSTALRRLFKKAASLSAELLPDFLGTPLGDCAAVHLSSYQAGSG